MVVRIFRWPKTIIPALASVLLLCACAQAGKLLNDSLVTRPFGHHIWQDVLTQSVNNRGEVDFGKLKTHPLRLNQYLGQLAACSPENDPTAFPTPNDKTAYWINAHNALAMRLILDHYPLSSLSDIPDLETDTHYQLGGKPYSLKKIRQKLGLQAKRDIRLMFTLTDYSLGAPAIQPQAYQGSNLKALEKKAVTQSIKDSRLFQANSSVSCVDLKLSVFFRGYERGLFSRPVSTVEDHDSLEEGMVPVAFTSWTGLLRPLLPPALYTQAGTHCGGDIEFLPKTPALRQISI